MNKMENIVELERDLAVAVIAGDLGKAVEAIDLLASYSGRWALARIEGRRRRDPGAGLAPVSPFPLPQPGHLPGSTLRVPVIDTAA